jgi:DNA-binding NarL/FixJ family response regulator
MTRIVIVDDHPVVREGLVAALDGKNEVNVVATFASADEALRAIDRARADVVILDLDLPGTSGLDAISRFPAPVLVLTAYATDEDVERALDAGARGYLLKGSPLADIENAIAAVARGESYLDSRVAARVIGRDSRQRLSTRERDVLRLVAAGDSNKQIAVRLGITERTAKFHVTSIFTKLGAENRAQAVAIAAEKHLI